MIPREMIKDNFNRCFICREIKIDQIHYEIAKLILRDNQGSGDYFESYTGDDYVWCHIRFCEDCWKVIAGPKFELQSEPLDEEGRCV